MKNVMRWMGAVLMLAMVIAACFVPTSADAPPHADFSKVYTELFEIGYPWLDVPESRLVFETDGLDADYQGFADALSVFAAEKGMDFYYGTHEEIKALSFYEYDDDGSWYRFTDHDGYLVRVKEKPMNEDAYSVTVTILLNDHTGVDVEAIVNAENLSYTIIHCMVG